MTDSTIHATASRNNVRAPRGAALSCQGWQQEAALRMLMNSLDPEVAERAEELIVHGGGKVAHDWESYDAIVAALRSLASDQTLLVQWGKQAGAARIHVESPRVLITNGKLAGQWNGVENFAELERAGPPMCGDTDAASWLYTGTQSALHTAYLVFNAAAQKHFGGSLAGKLVVSGGMGGTGGAQALAATWNGAAFLGIDADPEHIKRRLKAGYCDVLVNNLDEALRILKNAVRKRKPASVGLVGNCAELVPVLAERGIVPDLLTDQTPAHDPLAYIPSGLDLAAAAELRRRDPEEYRRRALDSIAAHVRALLDLQRLGSVVFEFGNGLGAQALHHGVPDAANIPGVTAEYLRPLMDEGRAPLLWAALSGEPSDIRRLDDLLLEQSPGDESLTHWIRLMQTRARFEGLPARVCWLAHDERVRFGAAVNDLVARAELKAPIALGFDLDGGASDSSNNETEAMRDGSGAIANWPGLSALLSAVSGASLVAIQNSGGASLSASLMVVGDGSREMAARIERTLAHAAGQRT